MHTLCRYKGPAMSNTSSLAQEGIMSDRPKPLHPQPLHPKPYTPKPENPKPLNPKQLNR